MWLSRLEEKEKRERLVNQESRSRRRGSNHCCLLGKMELETGSPMINASMLARRSKETTVVPVVPAPAIKIVM